MGKVLGGALMLLFLPAFVQSGSHWETYADWVWGYQWVCYPYYYTFCENWYDYGYYLGYQGCGCSLFRQFSTRCYPAIGYNCYTNCIGWILVTKWRCQNGWKGANCDVPICDNPTCRYNQICKEPNVCDCYRGPSGECTFEACADDGKNCYPGYCDKSTSDWKCVCPAGFTGPNCETITNTPDINNCYVQIFASPNGQLEQEVARANECAPQGLDPLPVWIGSYGANSISKIVVSWEADYVNQLPLPGPGITPYILNSPVPIGIIESNFTVSFVNASNVPSQSVSCVGPDAVRDNPSTNQKCNSKVMQWTKLGASSLISTNTTFVVSIEAQVGGLKKGNPNWAGGRFYIPQNISKDPNMNTTIRTAKFAFDLEPPYHCLSKSSDCPVFPIFLNQTMTSNPVITPTFNAWNDDGSGIDRFHVEVFYMQPDVDGNLVPAGSSPLIYADVNITLNNFRYTCPKPGVYSIVLTVYDKAKNYARARKIFNYDDHDSSVLETNSPIYLDKANPSTNYQFITNLEKRQNSNDPYQFNLIWTGHFDTSYKKEWLGPVKPWQIEDKGTSIDDSYSNNRYGLRSIDAVSTKTGVIGYEIGYVVDSNGTGGVGISAPNNFVPITDPKTESFPITINSSLKDGDTIIVWLKVYDLYGNARIIKTKTYIDTSRFNTEVQKTELLKHFPEQYITSAEIRVINRIGGIKNITFEVYDDTKKLLVLNGSMAPKVLEPPPALNSGTKRKRDTVTIPCRPNDPTCYCISAGPCYNVTQYINIDNCLIDRVAGDAVKINYVINTLSGWSLDGSIKDGVLGPEDIPCRNVYVSTGAKIGIGIAIGLLLLIILLLLILMCIRWKVYRKHPVPAIIRTTIHNTFGRNSAAAVNIMSENELYGTNEKPQAAPKKSNETPRLWANKLWDIGPVKNADNFDDRLVSGKDLQIGDVITEGRFAIIRKGFLNTGNEKSSVAIKALKSGYDKADPEVMRSKISFMANKLKPHPNVIRFMGAVIEDNDHASPVMLLEFCDKPLKDWLSEISKVDSEVFEDMLSFVLQIARGVQHLHDQGIIHRRLAVRNVLLKRTISGYEVKLIGFGPAKEDYDNKSNNQATNSGVAVVPLKWMAPETLDTLDSAKPVYDEKTDAWSYGVTAWEIFSKGEAPYANHKSPDIRSVLKRGERLNCPESCPPELFNQILHPCWSSNPKKRPTFTKICTILEQFRNGSSGYYAASSTQPRNQGAAPPPGYYAARDVLQGSGNGGQNNFNDGLYHDARSG